METSPHLKATIMEVVDNQINGNDPPETRQTYERLQAGGYSKDEAKRLIGAVLVEEMYDMTQEKRAFDRPRFVAALHRLPNLPEEE